jgi:hypothetical protein
MGSGELYPCPVTVLYSMSKETQQQNKILVIITYIKVKIEDLKYCYRAR